MSQPDKNAESQRSQAESEPTRVVPADDSASALVSVLDAYLADLQAGNPADREQLLAEHPELAPQLEQCLSGLEFIQRASQTEDGLPKQLGDFRIVREVGRGGMGVVYEAEQISLRRRVALKVLRFGAAADSEAMQRFQREAETVAGLHHTNIVPTFAIGSEDGVHYYAMQFIEGRSVAEFVGPSAGKDWSERNTAANEVANWGVQAAEALAHAHQRGVVHRDVKPSNLILDNDGRIWLTDFGLAKRTHDITLSVAGALLGTPRYMSPEQASSITKPVDHRTDIYSLGATLYELATGRPIFDADSPHAVITQILNDEPPRPRIVAPNSPRDLETIILKCLAKEPTQRYQSAQELADDLRAFVEDRPIKARRETLMQRGVRWVRKHRRGAAVSVASAVATILLIVGAVFGWQEYQWHHTGRVVFETDQSQVEAEVFDVDGNLVRPSFSLPTRQRVSLPEGRYRVRVSAPGRLSRTYQLELAARGNHTEQFEVELPSGELFKSIDVGAQEVLRIVDVDGSPDLFRVAVRDNKRQMWRIDGATGQEIWSTSLQSIDNRDLANAPDDLEDWSRVLSHERERTPDVAQPTPDLDGDGTGDLVWASAATRTLLAVSGASGKLLWWFKSRPELAQEGAKRSRLWGRAVDQPAVVDIDGDGTPDLVAMFAWEEHKWVEAVSGKEGTSLWQYELDSAWFQPPSWSSEEQLFAPQVIELNGKSVVAIAACTRLVLLDVQTGEPLWTADLGAVANQGPRFGDLDGDGQTEAVLLLDAERALPQLVAISLTQRRRLWERQLTAGYEPYAESPGHFEWPQVVDLDRDGAQEVIVPAYRDDRMADWHGLKIKCSALEVLNGNDGSLRWPRQLRRESVSSLLEKPDRFVVGPDLDGDGCDELFAASIGTAMQYSAHSAPATLYVDALSGKNGDRLWWWSQPLSNWADRVGELAWCDPGPDGWPMLLVPVVPWSGDAEGVYLHVLAGGSGEELHRIPGVFGARGIDLDGDGLQELCYRLGTQFDMRRGTGEFHAVHSPARAKWLRLHDSDQEFFAADDLNGDGVNDLLSMGDAMQAVSGETGWGLWRIGGHSSAHLCVPLSSPEGDLNSDGAGDLLVVDRYNVSYSSMPFAPLFALSGKTGELLWTAEIKTQAIGETHLLNLRDLDGDGLGEVIFVCGWDSNPEPRSSTEWKTTLWLTVHSGADGRLLWKHPLSQPVDRDVDGQFDLATGDLDADGTLDLVVPALPDDEDGNVTWKLQALSGSDGTMLWEVPLAERGPGEMSHQIRQPPWPVVGDLDGDGKLEVSVTDYSFAKEEGATADHLKGSVTTLDGESGQTIWTRTWKRPGLSYGDRPAVALVQLAGKAAVCVRTTHRSKGETIVLDANGDVIDRNKSKDRFDELAGPVVAAKWRSRFADNRRDKTLVLHNRQPDGLPHRVSLGPGNQDSLYCELQRPRDGDGPRMSRTPFTPSAIRDSRLARPLPWNFPERNRGPWSLSLFGDVAIAMLAMGVITVIVLIVPALLFRWAKRRRSRKLWGLAGIYVVGLIAFGIFARGGATVTPWYEMLLPGIGGALVGLPDVAFVVLFGATLFRGRWDRLLRIAGGVLLFGLLAAAALLWYDRPYREPGDYYTLDGWYWLLPAGAYLTGAVVVLFVAGRRASKWFERRKNSAISAKAAT